ncbi:hypothetical protein LTR36_009845 [Oleoguttula mirabilis]|uniref:Uncharacterized protein n=1 Tax=Oleoguttula mirabilis TaxID=1507867 RepID=A0AAV9J5A0_9PEZI|nr:hypothetical protein LTR36_009845 [Oleoguttula mirabilis]
MDRYDGTTVDALTDLTAPNTTAMSSATVTATVTGTASDPTATEAGIGAGIGVPLLLALLTALGFLWHERRKTATLRDRIQQLSVESAPHHTQSGYHQVSTMQQPIPQAFNTAELGNSGTHEREELMASEAAQELSAEQSKPLGR